MSKLKAWLDKYIHHKTFMTGLGTGFFISHLEIDERIIEGVLLLLEFI